MDNTILLVLTVILLGLMTIVLSVEKLMNRNIPGIGYWALSYFCSFIFSLYFFLKPSFSFPNLLSVFIFQSFSFITAFLAYVGAKEYVGKKVPSKLNLISIWFLILAFNYYFTEIQSNIAVRFVFSGIIGCIFFLLAAKTIAYGGLEKFPKRYFFALSCVAHGLFLLIRPLLINTEQLHLIRMHSYYSIAEIIFAESLISLVLIAMGVLTLANEYMLSQVKKLAELDFLTKVFNRGAFMNMINKTCSQMKRMNSPISLLAIDLDHFKKINDTWGHSVGDEALCHFVQVSNECLRDGDIIGRLGGEEFAILLPNTNHNDALKVAERIRTSLMNSPLKTENLSVCLTASFGVATANEDEDIKFFLKRADDAMYLAKKNGRNRVESITS